MSTAFAPAPVVADRKLLDFFEQHYKSTLTNRFLSQVRNGKAATADAVYALVLEDLRERWAWTIEHSRQPWAEQAHWMAEAAALAEHLGTLTRQREAGIAFGQWALDWDALPPEERERQKRSRSAEHIRHHMDREAPTEKQVAYLRGRGYTGPIESKGHASSLIDVLMRGGRVEVEGRR